MWEHISAPLGRVLTKSAIAFRQLETTMNIDLSKVTDLKEREKAAELYEAFAKADRAVEQCTSDDGTFKVLQEARDIAWDAYDVLDRLVMVTDDGNKVERCAASGIPLWDDDDTAPVLRIAVGLPPSEQEPLLPHPAYAEAK